MSVHEIEHEGRLPWWWGGESSQGFPDNSHSNAYESFRVVKVGPGVLFGFSVFSSFDTTQYIQLFDSATLPDDGMVPVFPFPVANASALLVNYSPPGRFFQYGIVLCNSSTVATKTIGSADCFFDAQSI